MSSCAFTLSLVLLVLLKSLLDPCLGVDMVLLHEVLGKVSHSLSSLEETVSVVNYSLDNVHLALTGLGNPGHLARQVRGAPAIREAGIVEEALRSKYVLEANAGRSANDLESRV